MRRLIIGNWKMYGLPASIEEATRLSARLTPADLARTEIVLAPPSTLLHAMSTYLGGEALSFAGQDCHTDPEGAFTGSVSAEMLAAAGARYCIVGHSERRLLDGDSNDIVSRKATACHRAGLVPVICVGESAMLRATGNAIPSVLEELEQSLPKSRGDLVVAYEPIWAVGTAKTPSSDDILEMHHAIKASLGSAVRVVYGGSMNGSNAASILALPGVDGGIVGGASLRADTLYPVIAS